MRDTKVSLAKVYPPGTIVHDPNDGLTAGVWVGRVVVCLEKRHAWQHSEAREHGPGRECGHSECGYGPPTDEACPWPMHVRWYDSRGEVTESHEGPGSVTPLYVAEGDALMVGDREFFAAPF